jgi:hypothetical protein
MLKHFTEKNLRGRVEVDSAVELRGGGVVFHVLSYSVVGALWTPVIVY